MARIAFQLRDDLQPDDGGEPMRAMAGAGAEALKAHLEVDRNEPIG